MPNPDEKDIVDETAAVVERLRVLGRLHRSEGPDVSGDLMLQAADLIERLSRERGTVPEGFLRGVVKVHEFEKADVDFLCQQLGLPIEGPHRSALESFRSQTWSVAFHEGYASAAPQPPSVSSEIETRTRPSPITAYCEPDDDRIFALLCARKDARTDDDAAAIAWAEDEIADLRKDRATVVDLANKHMAEIERLRAELEKAREALFSAKEHIDAERESLLQSSCRLDASGNPIVSTIDPYCIDLLARDDATLKTICDALAASPVPQNGEGN